MKSTATHSELLRRVVLLVLVLFAGVFSLSALAKNGVNHITQLIAPADLVGAYTCTLLSEAVFAEDVINRFKRRADMPPLTRLEMVHIINQFDLVVADFCMETRRLYLAQKDKVSEVVEKNMQNLYDEASWDLLAQDQLIVDWAEKNKTLLIKTLPITAIYKIVNAVAPDLLDPPLRTVSILQFGVIRDSLELRKLKSIVTGDIELIERNMIAQLLESKSFTGLLPSTYDPKKLQDLERDTKIEGVSLFKKSTVSLYDLSNQYNGMRRSASAFDFLRSIGLQESYQSAVKAIKNIKL